MTPAQCRAARALLDWVQADLVRQSGISHKSVADFERGLTKPHGRTLAMLTATLEAAGIEFIPRGVRMRAAKRTPPENKD